MAEQSVDVCILGAGLAGLTLARQLQRTAPELSISLLEHRRFPAPEATHKVGESTVEIASHYLASTLDLREHLEANQLPKFGLRLFLRGAAPVQHDLAEYDEIGASRVLPIPTYQLDRGRLENHLADVVCRGSADLHSGATIRAVDLSPGAHRVRYRDDANEHELHARYLIDTSGRRAWLRTQMDIGRDARHANHAVWFRIAGKFELDEWSDDEAWQNRCAGTPRRLSTNHFSGPGYWLWLIPLASGSTSVGLVFDPAKVDLAEVNSHAKLIDWLAAEHPLVTAQLAAHAPQDFHTLKDYSVGCQQVFSAEGWMLSGDAGVFADPFYSPGADFIAFANGYITELIARGDDGDRWQKFQNYFLTFFSNTISLYRAQYSGFGDRNMMVLKTIWDYSYYWGPLSKLFFTGRFTDSAFMDEAKPTLLRASALNSRMQRKFRDMASAGRRVGGEGRFFDHHEIPIFHSMKEELLRGDTGSAGAELNAQVERLDAIANTLGTLIDSNNRDLPDLTELGQLPAFA
jgi:flavin-dependent dehydrogenase